MLGLPVSAPGYDSHGQRPGYVLPGSSEQRRELMGKGAFHSVEYHLNIASAFPQRLGE